MKTKKECKTCKKTSTIVNLTTDNVSFEDVKTAYDYLQIVTKMDNEKWDFVEDIYNQIYPSKQKLDRGCSACLRNVAKAIEYEYKKRKGQ